MASIISAGTSTGTALNLTGDTSGILQLASNNGTVGLTVDASQNVTLAKNLSLSGSTSGAITLAAPTVAGTNTATLPAATGTVMVSGAMPAFSAYQSTLQAVSGATNTKIQFQTKEFDTASAFDNTTTYRFTPQVAGYYQVDSMVNVATPMTFGGISVYKNGVTFKTGATTNSSQYSACISTLIYMNGSTDFLEIYLYTNNATNSSIGAGSTWFQSTLVRAA